VIHRIETNYRSTPEILNLANGVLMAQPKGRHFDKELRAARGHMEKPYIVQAMDDREQAEFIVKRVRSLHEDEGVSLAASRSSTARTSSRSRRRSRWRAPASPTTSRAA
jgi:superfamily I DNA/RNA helicase